MTHYAYERLSALDSTFLVIEGPNVQMHVASTAIFEPGPLATPDGGVDIDRITAYVASRLHKIPRYRQRLAYIPIERHPVWVDDERFNLHYHIRHTRLPRPGDERQLKRMVGRINSQELDRGKPLWETWIVEGLADGRFAMISKVHHCMIDGISGVDLLSVLLSPTSDPPPAEEVRWIPRPVPSPMTLLRDEAVERLNAPLGLIARAFREPGKLLRDVREGIEAVGETVAAGMHLTSDTPFNQPVGPHRRFDWSAMDLSHLQEVRHTLGGSLNDVVLAIVAGAVGRFLERRGVVAETIDFRAFVPVSLRQAEERGQMGNRVAGWMVDLPIGERDPRKRLAAVQETTARLKQSKQARGSEILTEVLDWTGSAVLSIGMRLAAQGHPYNIVVTNVPGPPRPLYLLGARMLEIFPLVPLFVNQALGIALFSYAGRLFWGFNSDWDVVPDLHDFVSAIEASFEELCRAAPEPVRKRREKTTLRSDNGSVAAPVNVRDATVRLQS